MKKIILILAFILLILPVKVAAVDQSYGSSDDFYYSQKITGRVIDSATKQPISGARVTAECAVLTQCAHFYYYDDTDSNGAYTIDWLPASKTEASSKYNLKASRTPYYIKNLEYDDSERTITVTPYKDFRGNIVGSATNNNLAQNFELKPKPANLTCTVANESSGQAIASIKISVSTNADLSSATTIETNQDGVARSDFNAATYYVKTQETDTYYASDTQTITLSRGQNASLEFKLKEKPVAVSNNTDQDTIKTPTDNSDTSKEAVTTDKTQTPSAKTATTTTSKKHIPLGYILIAGILLVGTIVTIIIIRLRRKRTL